MALDFTMSQNQISQIAKMLFLNLDEIKNYIETHQEEYNEFVKQEEQQRNTEDKQNTTDNSLWTVYTDDTVCQVKIDKNLEVKNG